MERGGAVFVSGRNSFINWVVVVRVALILKHANKIRRDAIDWLLPVLSYLHAYNL